MSIDNKIRDDLIFAPASDRALSSKMYRAVEKGLVIRIRPGVFTPLLDIPVESIVKRNWKPIVEYELPGAVVSYRSAFDGRPDKNGVLIVSHGERTRNISYPGLTIEVRPGKPLPGDMPYGKLFISSEIRRLLECLESVKGSVARTAALGSGRAFTGCYG